MEIVITFLVAVAAGVTCHYIIKWLDGNHKDNKQPTGYFGQYKNKEEALNCVAARLGASFFCPNGLIITSLPTGIIAYVIFPCNIHFKEMSNNNLQKIRRTFCSPDSLIIYSQTHYSNMRYHQPYAHTSEKLLQYSSKNSFSILKIFFITDTLPFYVLCCLPQPFSYSVIQLRFRFQI